MKIAARIALGITILMVASILVPARGTVMAAAAQVQVPVPTIDPTKILPDPSPTETEDPLPDLGGGGGGGGGGGTGGGTGGGGGGGTGDGVTDGTSEKGDGSKPRTREGKNKKRSPLTGPLFEGTFTPTGSFDTERLVAVANRLRSLGVPMERIMKQVYAPFIIGGKAAWTNTWGAPRYGPAPGQVRTHEGQDVFCTYGDPVLAAEPGTVDYGDAGLGGKVARLYRPDGSYWYYAHLSDFNDKEFPIGSTVEAGDVVGFCGNTGNALTTPSHVHFGWYQAGGRAKDPMGYLVHWLHIAERRAVGTISKAEGKRVDLAPALTAARRFGDAFLPSVVTTNPEDLILGPNEDPGAFDASAEVPGNGLMAALSEPFTALAQSGTTGADPNEQVDDILNDSGFGSASSTEFGD